MVRARILSLLLMAAACAVSAVGGILPDISGPLQQLETVRRALRDELWSIAARHADEAAKNRQNVLAAHQMKLEALAAEGKYAEMLSALDAWDEKAEVFRYWRAWALAKLSRTEEARQALRQDFADERISALAHRLLARLAVAEGDRALADQQFRLAAVLVATNAPLRAENALEWAQALETLDPTNGVVDAIAVLRVEKVESAGPAAGTAGDSARLTLADLLQRVGKETEAERLRLDLVDAGTNTDERVFVLAACALAQTAKNPLKAREFAAKAVARASRPELRRMAGFRLGFVEFADADVKVRSRGVAHIRALVREFPDAPESRTAQLALADALLASGDEAAAAEEYRIFLEAYPDAGVSGDVHVLEGRAWALLRLGRRTEAVGTFARAAQIAADPADRDRCLYKQADALVADARYADAAALYGKIAAEGRELAARARFAQADALERAGQHEAAIGAFAELAEGKGAQAAEAALRLASREVALGHPGEAIAVCTRLLERTDVTDPALRGRALLGRGRAHYRASSWKRAAEDFKAAAALLPERRDETRFLMALCAYGEGREGEAKAEVVQLLAEAKDKVLRSDLEFWLARYDARHGNWLSAETGFVEYAQACSNSPLRQADAFVRAARAASARSEFARAVELVSSALKAAPHAPFIADALIVQGEALLTLARYEDALLVLDRALAAAPGAASARRAGELKADALAAMGAGDSARYEEALAAYRALEANRGDGVVSPSDQIVISFKVGRTLQKLHRVDEAVAQFYDKVVNFYETARRAGLWLNDEACAYFVRAAFALADHYEAQGQMRQAVNILKIVSAAHVAASAEAERRILAIKSKGGV